MQAYWTGARRVTPQKTAAKETNVLQDTLIFSTGLILRIRRFGN